MTTVEDSLVEEGALAPVARTHLSRWSRNALWRLSRDPDVSVVCSRSRQGQCRWLPYDRTHERDADSRSRDRDRGRCDLDPAGSLASLRTARQTEDAAAAASSTWRRGGPTCTRRSRSTRLPSFTARGCEHEEPIAGAGCPAVAEFCVAELGAVLGVSTTAAKRLMGHALELRHRLPRLWAQVHVRAGAGVAGAAGGGGHHPRHPVPDPGGRRVGRRPGRRGGGEGRSRAARPAGGGGDQAVRAGRGGAVRPRRVAEGRPPPRHPRPRPGALRRHPAPRGRDRHRRRPRPRPGPRPRCRHPRGARVHPVPRCPPGPGAG